MSVEHAPDGRRGFFGSFVALGLPAGIILSNLVFLVTSSAVSPGAFAEWAWRIPFIASALLVAVGLWVRIGLAESPIFAQIVKTQRARRMPIVDVLRHDARAVALAAGSYLGISTLGYIVIVYFVSYATRELRFPLTTTLALLLIAAVMFAISIFAFATWSDRFGRQRIMRWGNGALVLWSLVFFPLADTRSVPLVALALCGILIIQGAYIGPQPAVFSELFPTATRYSGASLSLTLGTILGGALSPAIAAALFGAAGNSSLITVYITAMSFIAWLATLGLKETYQHDLSR
jgi:MFS family permease